MLVDPESVRQFDVRLFMREDYAVLKQRREDRHGYVRPPLTSPRSCLEAPADLDPPIDVCSTRQVRLASLPHPHLAALCLLDLADSPGRRRGLPVEGTSLSLPLLVLSNPH